MTLLLSTIALRPYVFFFLAVYLWAAVRFWGWRRTLAFTAIAWAVAFVAEFSSTRIGIPFGYYVYIEATRGRELWVSNVPFFDSLSFTFLAYASYLTALAFLLPFEKRGRGIRIFDAPGTRLSAPALLLSALLFMLIDVVIDPVALRGERWFLGKIYYYPEGGIYFGVPLSNFLGWAAVGFTSVFLFQRLERRRGGSKAGERRDVTPHILTGVFLYYMVLAFNLGVTFAIGEALLGLAGVLIYLPATALLGVRIFRSGSGRSGPFSFSRRPSEAP